MIVGLRDEESKYLGGLSLPLLIYPSSALATLHFRLPPEESTHEQLSEALIHETHTGPAHTSQRSAHKGHPAHPFAYRLGKKW